MPAASYPPMLRRLAFNFWYFGRPPWDTRVSPPELLEFLKRHPAGRAIDIGCGTGTNVITLAQHGWEVTGVDFARRAIQIARSRLRSASLNAALFVEDATRLKKVSGSFDLALDLGCFHGLKDKSSYLAQLTRILRPGGTWLLYGFFKPGADSPGPGLVVEDLDLIRSCGLELTSRTDGQDKRGRPSAWFLYTRS